MPLTIGWPEMLLRLGLAVLAGTMLGLDRTERAMPAGLRTTLLVCLAAAISMIQVNLLLVTVGKTPESFSVLDLMRLPLGILTGMGFIGAGAIIRQKGRVSGVTTAATLWFATVLGLCFGGGQHGLGLAALGLGVIILWLLKRLEGRIPQERHGVLSLIVAKAGPTDDEIRSIIKSGGGHATLWSVTYRLNGEQRKVSCDVRSSAHRLDPTTPEFVQTLVERSGVRGTRWRVE